MRFRGRSGLVSGADFESVRSQFIRAEKAAEVIAELSSLWVDSPISDGKQHGAVILAALSTALSAASSILVLIF